MSRHVDRPVMSRRVESRPLRLCLVSRVKSWRVLASPVEPSRSSRVPRHVTSCHVPSRSSRSRRVRSSRVTSRRVGRVQPGHALPSRVLSVESSHVWRQVASSQVGQVKACLVVSGRVKWSSRSCQVLSRQVASRLVASVVSSQVMSRPVKSSRSVVSMSRHASSPCRGNKSITINP